MFWIKERRLLENMHHTIADIFVGNDEEQTTQQSRYTVYCNEQTNTIVAVDHMYFSCSISWSVNDNRVVQNVIDQFFMEVLFVAYGSDMSNSAINTTRNQFENLICTMVQEYKDFRNV